MRTDLAIVVSIWALATAAEAQRPAQGPCAADVKALCADVEPGGGRIGACLRKNSAKLSVECKTALEQRRAARQAFKEMYSACQSDIDRLCKDIPSGGGRVHGCLRSHADQLSVGCREALAKRPGRGAASAPPGATPASK